MKNKDCEKFFLLSERKKERLFHEYYDGSTIKKVVRIECVFNGDEGPHMWIKNNGLGNWEQIIHLKGKEIDELRKFLNRNKEIIKQ